jgi:MerR family redox-sensitive transcriptional activator SoxR
MTVDQTIRVVQMAYPQVYLACHTRHQRKHTTEHRLSQRDAAILAHLDEMEPAVPGRLARHMAIGRSTLSEALKRLVALGYVRRADDESDGRLTSVLLTARGSRAIRDTSVLETRRLQRALAGLDSRDLSAIAVGLARLAAACRAATEAGSDGPTYRARPPRRVSGRRVYDRGVFESIALVRLAQEAGFTVAEMRELPSGFDRATPASTRWQALARRKLADVAERIERAQRMKELLERLLRCRCETLGQCVQKRVAEFG